MTDNLEQTLKQWRQSSFEYGERDCMLSLAEYAARCGWPDVRESYRGRYNTHDGAEAMIAASGGIPAIIERVGLCRIPLEEARPGDIVMVRIGDQELGAICTGPGIVARLERGTVEINLRFVKILAAWRI